MHVEIMQTLFMAKIPTLVLSIRMRRSADVIANVIPAQMACTTNPSSNECIIPGCVAPHPYMVLHRVRAKHGNRSRRWVQPNTQFKVHAVFPCFFPHDMFFSAVHTQILVPCLNVFHQWQRPSLAKHARVIHLAFWCHAPLACTPHQSYFVSLRNILINNVQEAKPEMHVKIC